MTPMGMPPHATTCTYVSTIFFAHNGPELASVPIVLDLLGYIRMYIRLYQAIYQDMKSML
jgi:hypothetical protein